MGNLSIAPGYMRLNRSNSVLLSPADMTFQVPLTLIYFNPVIKSISMAIAATLDTYLEGLKDPSIYELKIDPNSLNIGSLLLKSLTFLFMSTYRLLNKTTE